MAQRRAAECASSSAPPMSLAELLEAQARRVPEALALVAPERTPLTYGRLYTHIGYVGRALRTMGIHCNDRVALVLPNGPEMAVAFLSIAASATCVPLNPASSAAEFDFSLTALQVQRCCC